MVSQFWDLGIYIAYFPKLNTASGKLNPSFNLSQGGDFLSLAFPKIGNNILKYFPTCAKIVPSFSHILGRKPIGLPTLVFLKKTPSFLKVNSALGKINPNFYQSFPMRGKCCPKHFPIMGKIPNTFPVWELQKVSRGKQAFVFDM